MNDSYAFIPTKRVVALCEATLEHIAKRQEEQRTEAINEMVAAHEKSWWRKLLRKPVMSFEEAKIRYWAEARRSTWEFQHVEISIRMYGWGSKDVAERLLALSKKTESKIMMIASKDLEYIE